MAHPAQANSPRRRLTLLDRELAIVRTLHPSYVSVSLRWVTWLISLAIVLPGAPTPNLERAPALLVATAAQTLLFTLYLPVLRPLLRRSFPWQRVDRLLVGGALPAALDVAASLAVLSLSGGWGSPFYEYALTSVLMPSLRFGYRGALIAAAAFSAGYLAVTATAGPGLAAATRPGSLDVFIASVANPWLVGLFVAYLSAVQAGYQRQTERAREALRRNQELQRRQEALIAQQERGRIAREIHDGIAQSLYMLSLNLETLAELAEREDASRLNERLSELVGLSKQTLWEVRHYIFDLKPLLDGQQSVVDTLRNQVREFRAVSGLAVELEVRGPEREVPLPVRAALYRIAQEALANVFKHAHATRVSIALEFESDAIRLQVRDDGRGLAPGAGGGYGLGSMAERARACGGTLDLDTPPEGGTRLTARLLVPGGSQPSAVGRPEPSVPWTPPAIINRSQAPTDS